MNLGGASQSHRSFTNFLQEIPINDQEASSSRSNLPIQMKWTKSHPFELIIGDACDGVKTRSATQIMNVKFTAISFLRRTKESGRSTYRMLIGLMLPCKKNSNPFERNKV